jgi:AraC-like DNA-binding protein
VRALTKSIPRTAVDVVIVTIDATFIDFDWLAIIVRKYICLNWVFVCSVDSATKLLKSHLKDIWGYMLVLEKFDNTATAVIEEHRQRIDPMKVLSELHDRAIRATGSGDLRVHLLLHLIFHKCLFKTPARRFASLLDCSERTMRTEVAAAGLAPLTDLIRAGRLALAWHFLHTSELLPSQVALKCGESERTLHRDAKDLLGVPRVELLRQISRAKLLSMLGRWLVRRAGAR